MGWTSARARVPSAPWRALSCIYWVGRRGFEPLTFSVSGRRAPAAPTARDDESLPDLWGAPAAVTTSRPGGRPGTRGPASGPASPALVPGSPGMRCPPGTQFAIGLLHSFRCDFFLFLQISCIPSIGAKDRLQLENCCSSWPCHRRQFVSPHRRLSSGVNGNARSIYNVLPMFQV